MKLKKIINILTTSSIILTQNLAYANNMQVYGNDVVHTSPTQQIPDAINYQKLNASRSCTPAELLVNNGAKTSCNVCDKDQVNIVLTDSGQNRQLMRKYGGILVTSDVAQKYNNNYNEYVSASNSRNGINNQNLATNNNTNALSGSRYNVRNAGTYSNSRNTSYSILFTGYRLKGQHPTFKPINNRTVCETIRPAKVSSGDSKFNDFKTLAGAGLLAIGGKTLSGSMNGVITSPNGGGANIGGGGGASVGGGMGLSAPATESFACLEYYTNTNTSMSGGDHLRANQTMSQKCQQPMQTFYNTKMDEIYCYGYPCDGIADGAFKPTTIALRYMYLMTNPYIMYGQTLAQSARIASSRPMMMMGF